MIAATVSRLGRLVAFVVALSLAACGSTVTVTAPAVGGGGGGTGGGTAATAAPTRAAPTVPAATSGEGGLTRDGYELWKETYNAAGGIMAGGKRYRIETKYYDDKSNAQKSATLAEKLIKEDKINFLLGP